MVVVAILHANTCYKHNFILEIIDSRTYMLSLLALRRNLKYLHEKSNLKGSSLRTKNEIHH